MEHNKHRDQPHASIIQERERLGAPPRRAFPERAIPQMRRPSLAQRLAAKVKRSERERRTTERNAAYLVDYGDGIIRFEGRR
jgi:hypothetical protein